MLLAGLRRGKRWLELRGVLQYLPAAGIWRVQVPRPLPEHRGHRWGVMTNVEGDRAAKPFRISFQESPAQICRQDPRRRIPRRICRSGSDRRCKDRSHSRSPLGTQPYALVSHSVGAEAQDFSVEEDQARIYHDHIALFQALRTHLDRRNQGRIHHPSYRCVSRGSRRRPHFFRMPSFRAPKPSASPMGSRWSRLSSAAGRDQLGRLPCWRYMPRRRPQGARSSCPRSVS